MACPVPDSGRRADRGRSRSGLTLRFLVSVEHRKLSGQYVEPSSPDGVTLEQYSVTWLERQHWRDSTATAIESILRNHVPGARCARLSTITRKARHQAWGKRSEAGAVDRGHRPSAPRLASHVTPSRNGGPTEPGHQGEDAEGRRCPERALTPEQVEALAATAPPVLQYTSRARSRCRSTSKAGVRFCNSAPSTSCGGR